MTEGSLPQPAAETEIRDYMNVWAENMEKVLTQIAGAAFTLESGLTSPADVPLAEEHDLQIIIVAAGSIRGEMSLRCRAV